MCPQEKLLKKQCLPATITMSYFTLYLKKLMYVYLGSVLYSSWPIKCNYHPIYSDPLSNCAESKSPTNCMRTLFSRASVWPGWPIWPLV